MGTPPKQAELVHVLRARNTAVYVLASPVRNHDDASETSYDHDSAYQDAQNSSHHIPQVLKSEPTSA